MSFAALVLYFVHWYLFRLSDELDILETFVSLSTEQIT